MAAELQAWVHENPEKRVPGRGRVILRRRSGGPAEEIGLNRHSLVLLWDAPLGFTTRKVEKEIERPVQRLEHGGIPFVHIRAEVYEPISASLGGPIEQKDR
jgi:hypothetical protein